MVARRRKLLLADDSPTIQKVVSLTFSDEGMQVTAVGTGDEAVRELERDAPDVVLADIHMPGVGGYELCERIKSDAALAHIPVVLLVSEFEPYNEAEARRVGADEVLTKPFQSIRELVGKVGALFGGKQPAEETRVADSPQSVPDAAAATPPAAVEVRDGRSAAEAFAPRRAVEAEPRAPEAAPSFNDYDMDDRMIESRPADTFGVANAGAPRATREIERSAQAESAPVFASSEPGAGFEPRTAEPRPVEPTFMSRAASAAAADDALLDLGGIESSPSVAESDDFVLDLDDESPASFPSGGSTARELAGASFSFGARESASSSVADAAGAFAEAAHGGGEANRAFTEQTAPAYEELSAEVSREPYARGDFIEPRVVPAEEPEQASGAVAVEDLSVEGDIARPPLEASQLSEAAYTREVGSTAAVQPEAGLLSPEVIDTIARRAVEMLSERVVREIAWEVVPELAERLIKQRLDEIAQK